MGTISVIIPAINEENCISTALESLRNQTYRNFEIIVKDGESTDRTVKIARRYTGKVISCEDVSVGQARNQGAENASGKILVFMDADSKLPPDALEKIEERFEKDKPSLLIPRYVPKKEILENNGRLIQFPRPLNMFWSKIENLLTARLMRYAAGMLMPCDADSFEKVGGFDENLKVCEDQDISHRLRKVGKVIYDGNIVAYFSLRRYVKLGLFRTFYNYSINSMRLLLGIEQPKHPMIR